MYSPIRTIIKNKTNQRRTYHITGIAPFILSPNGTPDDTRIIEGDIFSGSSEYGPRTSEPLVRDVCDRLIEIRFEIEFPFLCKNVNYPIMSTTQNCRRAIADFVACGGYKEETNAALVEDNLPVDSEPTVGETVEEQPVIREEINTVQETATEDIPEVKAATEPEKVVDSNENILLTEAQNETTEAGDKEVTLADAEKEATIDTVADSTAVAEEPVAVAVEKKQTKKGGKKSAQKIKVD